MTANHILHVTPRPDGVDWTLECLGGVGNGSHIVVIDAERWSDADLPHYEAEGRVDHTKCWAQVCLDEATLEICLVSELPMDGAPWPVSCEYEDGLWITYAGGDA